MTVIEFELPLPSKNLSPNARVHWSVKAKSTQLARSEAAFMAARYGGCLRWESASVQLTFTFPDKRSRDKDNLLSSCKAIFDGIADAGVVTNDRVFTHLPVVITEPNKKSPGLRVRIFKGAHDGSQASAVQGGS